MTDKKLTALGNNSTPKNTHIIYTVADPSGTPTSWRIPIANAFATMTGIHGVLYNGKIAVTVAGNNITVALKTMAGADPSATDAVYIRVGDAFYGVSAALSVTKNAGTNWFNAGSAELATKEVDYFVYLGYNVTDGVTIGFARIPYATIYSDFSVTSTNEKYAAISTITHAAASDPYAVIGRFAATLSAGAGYTWTVPTFTAANLIQRPIYETRWLTWVPTHSRSGTNYTNLPATNTAIYKIVGENLDFEERHTQNGTPGGTNFQRFTLPFSSKTQFEPSGVAANESTAVMFLCILSSVNIVQLYKYDGTAEATASNVYHVNGHVPAS